MKKALKWLGVTIAGIIVISIIASVGSNRSTMTTQTPAKQTAATSAQPKSQQETPEQFKASCEKMSYDEMARNADKHKGKRVVLTGEVVQAMESGNNVYLRVNVTKKGDAYFSYWDDTIFVNYTKQPGESKILEKDIIQLWGTLKGYKTYTAVLGQQITIPEIDAKFITVAQKRPSE